MSDERQTLLRDGWWQEGGVGVKKGYDLVMLVFLLPSSFHQRKGELLSSVSLVLYCNFPLPGNSGIRDHSLY